MALECVQVVDTVLNADSVEWCPNENFEQWIVGGTYQLNEATNESAAHRSGSINLYTLQQTPSLKLILKQQINVDGVLDIKWNPKTKQIPRPTFGVVNAKGSLSLYQLDSNKSKIESINEVIVDENGLALALDWNTHRNQILASTSNGYLSLVELNDDGLKVNLTWKAHDYEAWTCAFDQSQPNTIYSGGDDCNFNIWDTRTNPVKPTSKIKKHQMGVTNINVNPFNPNSLCTGSYDEHLFLWDARHFKKPISDIDVGGGIWRIKHDPFNTNHVAVAAMHNGVHLISLNDPTSRFSFTGQDSLVYGIDWCHDENQKLKNDLVLASCSFYDHNVRLLTCKIVIDLK